MFLLAIIAVLGSFIGFWGQNFFYAILVAHSVAPLIAQFTVIGTTEILLLAAFIFCMNATSNVVSNPLAAIFAIVASGIGLNIGMIAALVYWASSVSIVVK